jgi:hypothetical protein
MDYVMYPELETPVVLIWAHAVARRDDGTLNDRTECGKPALFRPDEEPLPWPTVHRRHWCQKCAETAEGVWRHGVTGERIYHM